MIVRASASSLYVLVWLVGHLPGRVRALLAAAGAGLWAALRRREYEVARRNLALIHPQLPDVERERRVRAVLRGTALNLLDTLSVWSHSPAHNLRRAVVREGEALYRAALAAPRGVIVAAPHYGNWELLNQYLGEQGPIAIVYRPPAAAVIERLLRRARRGRAIEQVRAEIGSVRRLLRVLQAGGTVGILPDQQPKLGEGVFAPFFGIPALTMTLIQRLARRTGAVVLFAFAERRADGGHDLHFRPADPAVTDPDPTVAATALNAGIEAIARRDFRQYQWTYKRFSLRPAGSGETNPYWPECYSRRALRRAHVAHQPPP